MSKVGTIAVDVSEKYSDEYLLKFAEEHDMTLEQAKSLAHEAMYRKEYNRRYNQLPEVKAERKVTNKVRNARRRDLLRDLR